MLPYFPLTQLNLGLIVLQVWGLFAAIGFLCALFVSLKEAKKKQIEEETVWDCLIIALLGMIVGGRIFYVLSDLRNNFSGLADFHSGFSVMGGLMLSAFSVFIYLRHKKQNIKRVFDVLTLGIITALIFTRVGCFLVNDHMGSLTALPWGIAFTDGTVRHPVALYHIFFLILIFALILKNKNKQKEDGSLFFNFCFLYAILSFLTDFSRCNDSVFCDPHFSGLTATQWIMLIFLFLYSYIKKLWSSFD